MKTFSPADVVVNFHGFDLSGFADGTFVQISRDSDSFSDVAGADGEVAISASADKRGSIKVTLLQTSASNDLLSAELAKHELTKQLPATGAGAAVKDLFGTTQGGGSEAWLLKPADVTLDKDIQAREWTIRVANLHVFVGGN